MKTLAWTPFTGLGLYGGFRGNRWLRNRIKIYKQFVVSSLLNQTDQDFIIWIQWRPEERTNQYVKELETWLRANTPYKVVFTYGGLCFWDDKYPNEVARERLTVALKKTLPDLLDVTADCEDICVLLVPSDDLYGEKTIEASKRFLNENREYEAIGFTKGYITNYHTKEVLEYNPNTNPPFFAVRFPRNVFFDPGKHLKYISTKVDEGQYKAGTPYPSHEWIPNAFKMAFFENRGFMVGTHGENISTHFNHPFGGRRIEGEERLKVLKEFGILNSATLELPKSYRKALLRKLPYKYQRKLRFIFGERLFNRIYQYLRN
jgi:hypothetical protein